MSERCIIYSRIIMQLFDLSLFSSVAVCFNELSDDFFMQVFNCILESSSFST